MSAMRTALTAVLLLCTARLAQADGAAEVRAQTGRAVGLKGVAADEADFRAERAAIDNFGQPICTLFQRRHATLVTGGPSDTCKKRELVDVTAVDPEGRPVPGLQLDALDARTDANGKLRVPKDVVACGGRLSGQGWSDAEIPPHAVHARVKVRPVAALGVTASLGLVPCPKPTLEIHQRPDAPPPQLWSPGPGVVLARGLEPGEAKLTVSCGLPGTAQQELTVKLEQMTDAKAVVDFPDPTVDKPENHFSVRGVVAAPNPLEGVRVRVHCEDVIRTVAVNKDGSFEAAHLPQSPRCGLVYGTAQAVRHAVISSPADGLKLELN
jgi:hypothetical protein